jgi:hypothetical protein
VADEIARTNGLNGGEPQLVTVSNGMLHPKTGFSLLNKKMLPEEFLALYKQYKTALEARGWLKSDGKRVLSKAEWTAKKSGTVPGETPSEASIETQRPDVPGYSAYTGPERRAFGSAAEQIRQDYRNPERRAAAEAMQQRAENAPRANKPPR